MLKTFWLLLLGFIYIPLFAQKKNKKKWQIVIIGDGFRSRGVFKSVTDTSVILLNRKADEEITFDIISKIKLIPLHNKAEVAALGGTGGVIMGAVAGSTSLSAGRTGEPAALGGIIGGIGGGVIGGLTGIIVTPLIRNAFAKRKFYIKQNDFYLQNLISTLKEYLPPLKDNHQMN